jgi:hypothetical protein
MRLLSYRDEDKHINILTSWEYQHQLYNFDSLKEMFDKDVEFDKIVNTKELFSVDFTTSNDKWEFKARRLPNDIYGVLFYRIGDSPEMMFKSKRGSEYIGEVFSGVFRCIEKMIEDRNVNGIAFKTTDSKLLPLYKRMSKWVEKRFPDFELCKELQKKNPTEFVFMKKGAK